MCCSSARFADPDSAVAAIQRLGDRPFLVLATIHGADTADALERMSSALLPDARAPACLGRVFASQLVGELAQRLRPSVSIGFVLAVEYFTNVGAMRASTSRMGAAAELRDFIEQAGAETAQSMLRGSVAELCRTGQVSEAVALATVDKPGELTRLLRGISSATSRR